VFIAYFQLFHCLRYRGQANVPAHGPVIIAPNHVSYYDAPLIAAGMPFRMRFMAMEPLFGAPILGRLIANYGAFPVKLKSADKGAIAMTLRVLRNNEAVLIFPEGGRTEDGKLVPFEQGAARIALQTGATIVPVTITGVFDAWPKQRLLPRWFRPVTVKYHAPVTVAPVRDRDSLRPAIERLNEEIARPIARRLAARERLRNRIS
jgi:1-acyl-sn-glycerol-3-phosphate acyltransferase